MARKLKGPLALERIGKLAKNVDAVPFKTDLSTDTLSAKSISLDSPFKI
jgi:hypothetical protein